MITNKNIKIQNKFVFSYVTINQQTEVTKQNINLYLIRLFIFMQKNVHTLNKKKSNNIKYFLKHLSAVLIKT